MKTLLKIANKLEYIVKNSQYYNKSKMETEINKVISSLNIKGIKNVTDVEIATHQEANSASVGFLLNVESKFAQQMQYNQSVEKQIVSAVVNMLNATYPMYSGWKAHFTIVPV